MSLCSCLYSDFASFCDLLAAGYQKLDFWFFPHRSQNVSLSFSIFFRVLNHTGIIHNIKAFLLSMLKRMKYVSIYILAYMYV